MKKISGVPPPFYSSTISEEKAENTRFRGRNDNIRAVRSQVTEKKSPEEVASNINIKLESQPSMDINESADAFIKKFRQQLLIQRLESIENYEQMLARGRVKDHFTVECDDYGVSFIEAHITTNISEALQNPHPLLLEQLMPYKPHELITTTQFNLAVQVSYFGCGGLAICVCFRHCIADGATAANFIKSWSAVASCGDNNIDAIEKDVVFDFSSIFPPENWSGLSTSINSQELIKSSSTDTVVKRFVFDGSKMAALREIIGNRPTRFEAVFALMWKAVTSAKTEGDEFVASIPVNLRRKMNPPISDQCMGNVFAALMANWPLEETINYKDFVEKLRELISLLNDDYVKKAFPNGWILRRMKIDVGRDDTKSSRRRIFHISGCCGLPFYEADFGWGKPNSVTFLQANNAGDNIFVNLIDTCDGKGVEAWVAMSKEEMLKFEQDSQVVAYASFNQIA